MNEVGGLLVHQVAGGSDMDADGSDRAHGSVDLLDTAASACYDQLKPSCLAVGVCDAEAVAAEQCDVVGTQNAVGANWRWHQHKWQQQCPGCKRWCRLEAIFCGKGCGRLPG